jgi:hypothetical protein
VILEGCDSVLKGLVCHGRMLQKLACEVKLG